MNDMQQYTRQECCEIARMTVVEGEDTEIILQSAQ